MRLVLFVLVLNSSLAHAEGIVRITPARVQPGQVITLHGQFTVANFHSRQYRIMVLKKIAPRPKGTINGLVTSFRVTPTSIMVRIPRTWRGKSVYSGEYSVAIRDVHNNRTILLSDSSFFITSGTRTPLQAAQKSIRGTISKHQQQRLGGNIGRAASPRSPYGRGNIGASITNGAPQMKLTLTGLKVNNRSAYAGVNIGDNVVAAFNIQNLGTAPGQVKAGYMSGGARFTTNGFVTVARGQTVPVLLNIRIKASDRNIHPLRGVDGAFWSPVFALLTTGNNPYRDSYMADNRVRGGSLANISVKAKVDLAITSIENIRLTETYIGGNRWDDGTVHPVSLEFIVKMKNNGIQKSRPTHFSVTVMGKRSAFTKALRDKKLRIHVVGRCAYWPICTLNKDVSIAAIAAGQTVTFRVRFDNIPHRIVYSKHYSYRVAVGPYICGSTTRGIAAGIASINILLRQANVDEPRLFRRNNKLTLTGRFGTKLGTAPSSAYTICGMVNTKVDRR